MGDRGRGKFNTPLSALQDTDYQPYLFYSEYFDKGLKNVIDSFEKAKEWADLSNCLQKVKK